MPLRNTERDKYKLEWKHYTTTPVMLTHHARMVMSNYLVLLDFKTQNIKMWCRFENQFYMEFAKNVTENITLHFQHTWKRSDKIWNVNHVVIPNFSDKNITVLGLVFYRETDIIYNKNVYPIANKIEVTQSVGRKVTQEWFNNMMSNPLVSDFWFKKGFTTLLATYTVNKIYPDYQIINLFVVQNQHYSFNLDSYYMWPSTSKVNSLSEIPNSIRAPFILRMMQHVLTEEIFQKGIRRYIHLNVHYIDFVEHMRQTASRINPLVDIGSMDNWASEKHCPIVKVVRNYRNPISQTKVWIQYIDLLKNRCIPVTFTTQEFPDFNNFTHHLLCQFIRESRDFELLLPFKENGWMIFNIQQIGYYRVNYDDENWQRIINYLQCSNYKKIHVLNRAQIIDDAFYLMIIGHIKTSIFLNIMPYLAEEEDYIAWYPMFKALEYMFGTFSVIILETIFKDFTIRAQFILAGILLKIKYEEIDDTDKLRNCLRQEAAKWACVLNDITCKEVANKKLKQHLQDPTKHKLLPWWKEWTYCNGLKITTKNETTWELMHTIGLEKSDTKFFEYLACPEDINLIKKYLDDIRYKQYNSTEQKYQYHLNGFFHIITKHAKNPIILEYILDHFNEIRPKMFI
ncbi:aminopeptidase N-like [Nylanderia fulva]|uniref:aminopeptidase N-like n=1 Tax=Nylanderia fulva TaxID=613905 RepID=UPI0010FBA1B9|nr:aminopeptidase N-like [Nylanderia fulva]